MPELRLVESVSYSGLELTKAYTGSPEMVSRCSRVCGVAPAARAMPVTTLVELVDEVVLAVVLVSALVVLAELELLVLLELELDELVVLPSPMVVESRALLSVKSACTVLAMVPVPALAVR